MAVQKWRFGGLWAVQSNPRSAVPSQYCFSFGSPPHGHVVPTQQGQGVERSTEDVVYTVRSGINRAGLPEATPTRKVRPGRWPSDWQAEAAMTQGQGGESVSQRKNGQRRRYRRRGRCCVSPGSFRPDGALSSLALLALLAMLAMAAPPRPEIPPDRGRLANYGMDAARRTLEFRGRCAIGAVGSQVEALRSQLTATDTRTTTPTSANALACPATVNCTLLPPPLAIPPRRCQRTRPAWVQSKDTSSRGDVRPPRAALDDNTTRREAATDELPAPTSAARVFVHIPEQAARHDWPERRDRALCWQLSTLLPSSAPSRADETHDRHAHEPYTTSLQQRQQQAADYYRAQHSVSRVSSSSGSAGHSLRRTPNFEDPRQRPRASSVDSAQQHPHPQPQRSVRFADHAQLSPSPAHRRRASEQSPASDLFSLHPALRISHRTASAIRFVLEEAIRAPYPFTPDLAEENAPMSDLTGAGPGRAANGGARTAAGPVPVQPTDRSNIRTPQMIMNQRREREAARADARAAEEQRKADEERRRSAERRAQAAGVAGGPPTTEAAVRRPVQNAPLRTDDDPYASSNPPMAGQTQDTSTGAQYARPRATSQSQSQPRPAPGQASAASAGDSRRPPPTQHSRHPSSTSRPAGASAQPPPPQQSSAGPSGSQPRQSSASNFPHAFERWETLSSHWEGLTSYWIRRLEANTDEIRREPLAQQMSRQITDLSAAGANLFHAVVELQRLRASSERKFQRWFYEHRQEQERAQEREAQLEHTLRVERDARADAVANMERMATEKKNADRMVAEMRRELQISKEEARRAWEELGRREQEERDRTLSLREGQPTLVGGVQVVPMAQGPGRHGSVSQRQPTGADVYGAESSSSHGIEQHYSYEDGQSPTDTDPFTGHGALRHEPDVPTLSQGSYVPTGTTSASAQPTIPAPLQPQQRTTAAQQPSAGTRTSQPEAFYQQPEAYLHRETATSIPEDERSYVTSHDEVTSEGDEDYAIDERGNYILDDNGHRIPFRELRQRDSDEYDVQEDRRRELEHLQHYGTAAVGPSGYATTSSGAGYPPNYQTGPAPDYSGAGYGDGWAGMRHHHPTRLSDVLEEDERSRTSPSRASQASRGLY
ncbi:hypothetical protein EJ04DRAFT_586906 [Polyplosphaeria fusca]|uniref:Uncharacterized protein n=1 Tax=Polyplosphaeria fusca TaxID=682080 RepID=A0A9P4V7E4_9PLEO|nr:hypothetical protein EJ04DRAFT_586906 [Polyplosphaeria fusca]